MVISLETEANDSGTVSGSHSYSVAGIYTVKLTVSDNYGASCYSTFQYVVVYDPSAGFVTGGGWIDSPAGAYTPDLSLIGRASFGFVSKYENGATIPSGQTVFNFRVADLNFRSTSYEWLVIAGNKAKFKGSGIINGSGDYGFMLTAIDGEFGDGFRIKIWDSAATDYIVYDNRKGAVDEVYGAQTIASGNIIIHKSTAAPPLTIQLPTRFPAPLLPKVTSLGAAFPNPFNPETWIPFNLAKEVKVAIRIYNVSGTLIRTLDLGQKQAGFYTSKDKAAYWNGRNEYGELISSGIYFYSI